MLLFGNLASLSPSTFANANSHVRAQVASLLIRQYTCLSLLGRTNTFGAQSVHRMLMTEISRQSEICLRRYGRFTRENQLKEPDIDTRTLKCGASGIAHHLTRGEYTQARLLEERILADEATDESTALARLLESPERAAAA